MNTDMLKEMKEYGMEIENHTAYHFELGSIFEDQRMTIEDGQTFLKENIEQKVSFYVIQQVNMMILL